MRRALGGTAESKATGSTGDAPPATHPFDAATGMDTAGLISANTLATGHPNDVYSVAYYGTAPSLFRAVLKRWDGVAADYSFVDLGCGKGRVVLLASEMGFRECVGVELNPALAAVAWDNVARWQHALSPIRVAREDATEFMFPTGKCLVYLFHPFAGPVLERLLERIAVQFAARPGGLDLLYVNPEFEALLGSHPGFQLLWHIPVEMSAEDAAADLLYRTDEAGSQAYCDACCSCWRWVGSSDGTFG